MARKRVAESPALDSPSRPSTPEYIKAENTDTGSSTIRAPSIPRVPRKRRNTIPRKTRVKSEATSSNAVPRNAATRTPEQDSDSASNMLMATVDMIRDIIIGILSFIGGTILAAISFIRKPLSVLIGLYILAVIASVAYQLMSNHIFMALSPVCKLPGVSLLDIPFCNHSTPTNKRHTVRKSENTDFSELMNLQFNFENILENSAGGSSLAFDLKKSEFAIVDLNTLVLASELLCREELSRRLENFVTAAKSTSMDLSRFGSSVNGVVDSLLSIDEYALRTLEKIRVSEIEASAGNTVVSWALTPFKPWGTTEVESNVLATFVKASNVMDSSIQELILRAKAVLNDLDDLENRLVLIQELVSREGSTIQKEYNEVLAELWTIVGGNRKKVAHFASHRTLLNNIAIYRNKALAHVSASLIQLQQMQADLDDLRDRVARPGLLLDSGKEIQDIPLEVHMETIRRGVMRLNSGVVKAKNTEHDYVGKLLGAHNDAIVTLDTRK